MNTARADWPSYVIVDAQPQQRRVVSRGAVAYHEATNRIAILLGSSAAALADNDYFTAEKCRRKAFALMRKLSEMIDETEREVCMDTDACDVCGSPSMHRCECDDDIPYAEEA